MESVCIMFGVQPKKVQGVHHFNNRNYLFHLERRLLGGGKEVAQRSEQIYQEVREL